MTPLICPTKAAFPFDNRLVTVDNFDGLVLALDEVFADATIVPIKSWNAVRPNAKLVLSSSRLQPTRSVFRRLFNHLHPGLGSLAVTLAETNPTLVTDLFECGLKITKRRPPHGLLVSKRHNAVIGLINRRRGWALQSQRVVASLLPAITSTDGRVVDICLSGLLFSVMWSWPGDAVVGQAHFQRSAVAAFDLTTGRAIPTVHARITQDDTTWAQWPGTAFGLTNWKPPVTLPDLRRYLLTLHRTPTTPDGPAWAGLPRKDLRRIAAAIRLGNVQNRYTCFDLYRWFAQQAQLSEHTALACRYRRAAGRLLRDSLTLRTQDG